MSAKPLAMSEECLALARPFTEIGGVFFALQGFLSYLHAHKLSLDQNIFAKPGCVYRFLAYVGAGYIGGKCLCYIVLRNQALERVYNIHQTDKRYGVYSEEI